MYPEASRLDTNTARTHLKTNSHPDVSRDKLLSAQVRRLTHIRTSLETNSRLDIDTTRMRPGTNTTWTRPGTNTARTRSGTNTSQTHPGTNTSQTHPGTNTAQTCPATNTAQTHPETNYHPDINTTQTCLGEKHNPDASGAKLSREKLLPGCVRRQTPPGCVQS